MSRPKKKDIVLTKDSVLSLMQEIYNELVEQRTTAIRIQNKLIGMMNDPKNVAAITGVLKEQQKLSTIRLTKSWLYQNYNQLFGKSLTTQIKIISV